LLDKAVDHALFAGLVESDGELIAIHHYDIAVTEFLVEDALAHRERRNRAGGFRHKLALDCERGAALAFCGAASGLSARGSIRIARIVIKNAVRNIPRLAVVIEATAALAGLCALPTGCRVTGTEGVHLIEARSSIARHPEPAGASRGLFHLHMHFRQFIEEARGDCRSPKGVNPADDG